MVTGGVTVTVMGDVVVVVTGGVTMVVAGGVTVVVIGGVVVVVTGGVTTVPGQTLVWKGLCARSIDAPAGRTDSLREMLDL